MLWLFVSPDGCVSLAFFTACVPGRAESRQETGRKWNVAWLPVPVLPGGSEPAISLGSYFYFFISTTSSAWILESPEEPGNAVYCVSRPSFDTLTVMSCELWTISFQSKHFSVRIINLSAFYFCDKDTASGNMCVVWMCCVPRFRGAFYSRFAHSEWEKTTSCIHKFCRYDWNLNKYILIREINLIKQVM